MTTTTVEPIELPSKYAKAIVGLLTAVIGVVVTALADNILDTSELVNIAIFILTSIGVWLVPNLPAKVGNILKLLIALLGAGLQALASALSDGITTQEWLLILLAILGAVGVGVIPNTNPALETTVNPDPNVPDTSKVVYLS
jgi:MFS family permease